MIEAVVKVGGSLGRGADLTGLGSRLGELGRRYPLLVVPGGGAFADVVREHDRRFKLRPSTAHWMAILAMDQYGHLLGDLAPGCTIVRTLEDADACTSGGTAAVLLPSELLLRADDLPHSWSVTSDSVAAWLARELDARLLVLLKDHRGMAGLAPVASSMTPGTVGIAELAASRGVDGHFADLVGDARFDLWIVNGEHPERLTELLDKGMTKGIRLVRPRP